MITPGVVAAGSRFRFDAWPIPRPVGNAFYPAMAPFTAGGMNSASPPRDAVSASVPTRLQFDATDPPPGRTYSLRMECRQHDHEMAASSYEHKERMQVAVWPSATGPWVEFLPGDEWWTAMWFKLDPSFVAPRNFLQLDAVARTASNDTFTKTAHGLVSGQRVFVLAPGVIGDASNTGPTANTFTRVGHGFVTGEQISLSDMTPAGGTGTGLTENLPYYVVNATANTFQLGTTPGVALDWGPSNVTDAGATSLGYFVKLDAADPLNKFQLIDASGTSPWWLRSAHNFTIDAPNLSIYRGAEWNIRWQYFDTTANTHKQSIALNYHAFDPVGGGWQLEYFHNGSVQYAYSGKPVETDVWYAFLMHSHWSAGSDGFMKTWCRKADEDFPVQPQASGTGANLASNTTSKIWPIPTIYRSTRPDIDIQNFGGVRVADTRAKAESLFPA